MTLVPIVTTAAGVSDELLAEHGCAWGGVLKRAAAAAEDGRETLNAYLVRANLNPTPDAAADGEAAAAAGDPEERLVAIGTKRPVKQEHRNGRRCVSAKTKDSKAWDWRLSDEFGGANMRGFREVSLWVTKHFLKDRGEAAAAAAAEQLQPSRFSARHRSRDHPAIELGATPGW